MNMPVSRQHTFPFHWDIIWALVAVSYVSLAVGKGSGTQVVLSMRSVRDRNRFAKSLAYRPTTADGWTAQYPTMTQFMLGT